MALGFYQHIYFLKNKNSVLFIFVSQEARTMPDMSLAFSKLFLNKGKEERKKELKLLLFNSFLL